MKSKVLSFGMDFQVAPPGTRADKLRKWSLHLVAKKAAKRIAIGVPTSGSL
jgi:hypothetical protein